MDNRPLKPTVSTHEHAQQCTISKHCDNWHTMVMTTASHICHRKQ